VILEKEQGRGEKNNLPRSLKLAYLESGRGGEEREKKRNPGRQGEKKNSSYRSGAKKRESFSPSSCRNSGREGIFGKGERPKMSN